MISNQKKYPLFLIFLCCFLFYFNLQSFAQEEADDMDESPSKTAKNQLPPFHDSIFKFNVRLSNPKKAGLYSALLPGLGQAYNKQYWKISLVAVAGGAVTGFLIFNTKKYNTYQQAYLGRIDNDPNTTDTFYNYDLSDIDLLRKTYRTYVQYTVIAGVACYFLNILDAFTASHMKTFDMSKNISFRFSPAFDTRKQVGLKLTIAKK
ncbi:MAG TPA: DUF5683 domain-containing protein [Chitinophagaceae bacterium]|nr:DUF5683 domain-containing protein [Chitinophagaceae bacterium]